MSKLSSHKSWISLLTAGIITSFSSSAFSAGFQLLEKDAAHLGNAYAGAASEANDASTGYYNPAGLTRLGGEQIIFGAVGVIPKSTMRVTSATAAYPSPTTGTPIFLGTGTAKSDPLSAVPFLHYSNRLNECWVFGLNVVSPFGLKNKFPVNSIVRYSVTRAELRTIDITPSIAYQLREWFSLGGGIDGVYTLAKLDSRLGFGVATTDGLIENTASDWNWGYHLGALLEPTDCLRFGATYHSKIRVKARGEAITKTLANFPELRQGVKANITLPESITLSAYADLNNQWAVLSDVQWVRWQRFDQLALRYDSGTQIVIPEHFKSTVRVSLGTKYRCSDDWTFRVGAAYDKTPTRDLYRRIEIPDQSRIWAALGAQYRITKCLAFDVGYSHLFFRRAHINQSAPIVTPGPQTFQSLQGTSKTHADLVGIQLTWDLV